MAFRRCSSGFYRGCIALVGAIVYFSFLISISHAQISKGHQILINRGLQVQGMVTRDDVFHLTTYSNANYTSINWLWDSNPSLMGAAPGFPWSRWVGNESQVPPQGSEGPYMSQLVSLQLGDEWNLNDSALRDRAVNWFNAIRANFPNTILYMNNFGGQVGDAQLGDFTTRARPDMLCFDTYPWRADQSTGNPLLGPPTPWYGDLRRYREHANGANIPLGSYVQTFHAIESTIRYRDPSPSELRLLHSGALAFNAKVLIDFTYNTGASSLFTTPGGDSNPTPLLAEKTDAARRARNLGRALVRLKPVTNDVSIYTTSMMFIRGRNANGTPNTLPIGFGPDPQAQNEYSEWAFARNDPYLTGWAVTNRGTRNNGQRGDVIVSWFRPLDESLDGLSWSNQIYMMVVNALTDPTGTAADCLQEIRLNFTSALQAVVLLDPVTGQLQTNTLAPVGGSRQLVLNLNGGDAALFKFANGAPFVGFPVPPPPPLISTGAVWKYLDNGSDQGSTWRETNYNDSAWASGAAQLGYGDGDEGTTVRSNRADGTRIVTTYFRRTFTVADASYFSNLTVRLLRDDGGIVYLNGAEVFRSNMPEGPIDFNALASTNVPAGDETTNYYTASVNPALLVTGTNLLAVEIHQADTNSSDLSFDLALDGRGNWRPNVAIITPANGTVLSAPTVLSITAAAADDDGTVTRVEFFVGDTRIGQDTATPFTINWSAAVEGSYTLTAVATDNAGKTATSAPVNITVQSGLVFPRSAWKYLDDGSNQGVAWRSTNFNDSAWRSGPAQLGYGDGDEATLVGFGPNETNKYITTYFRRWFPVTNPGAFTNLLVRVLRDDGAVVYLNEREVFRSNMPGGTIGYRTLASGSVPAADETTNFHFTNVNPNLLFNGTNLLAIEVHQSATNSSDMSFDLELIGLQRLLPPSLTIGRTGANAILSWSAFTKGFRLESTPTLAPANWSAVTNAIFTAGGQHNVTVSLAEPSTFFRLRQQ